VAHIDRGLVLRVRLLAQPCLRYWEICDGVDGRLVESSWTSNWIAFASRQEAVAAGARRLAELETARFASGCGSSARPDRLFARGAIRRAS
jgi:hypothetical protein